MSAVLVLVTVPLLLAAVALVVFLVYTAVRYGPIVSRIFEEKPLFLPLRLSPPADGESVRFPTAGGLKLDGSYYSTTAQTRVGVLVFCHEFLSDRWSFQPYLDPLRAIGYDIFSFDFRNHGTSDSDPLYHPLQWVTDQEVEDLQAALRYVRARPDHDPAGVGLFGISRGGSTALIVAARDPGVWGVITDGAFPTGGTMVAYITRWAQIYVASPFLWRHMPVLVFRWLALVGRVRSERRLHCRFTDVERAVGRLAPRPWLAIHGEKDAYIPPAIVRSLFDRAGTPKELWIVPRAKHNRCRELAPVEYAARIVRFLAAFAPRRELLVRPTAPREVVDTAPAVGPATLLHAAATPDTTSPSTRLVAPLAVETIGSTGCG